MRSYSDSGDAEGLPAGWGEGGGDALADELERRGGDQSRANQAVGGGLVAAAAAVEEQVRLGAQAELGSALRDCAQDRPVASAEGVRAAQDGLRAPDRVGRSEKDFLLLAWR